MYVDKVQIWRNVISILMFRNGIGVISKIRNILKQLKTITNALTLIASGGGVNIYPETDLFTDMCGLLDYEIALSG